MLPKSSFPRDIAAINSIWLTEVLQRSEAINRSTIVCSVEPRAIGDSLGQTGEVARLVIQYEDTTGNPVEGPSSLVAKFATSNEARRKASVTAALYAREVNFYKHLADKVSLRSPKCLFAEIDSNGEYFMILLEDFRDHRAGDQIVGTGPEEAELATAQLAMLHAPFWNKSPPAGFSNSPKELSQQMMVAGWDEMVRTFGDSMSPEFRAMRDDYFASMNAFAAWSLTAPQTLQHGDFKADNLLFAQKGESDPIVALDWQGVGLGKAVADIGYFITHNMSIENRKAHEKNLLSTYLKHLLGYGVNYAVEDMLADYRIALASNLIYPIYICGVNINPNPRAILRKQHLLKRISSSIEDWHLAELLPFRADQGQRG